MPLLKSPGPPKILEDLAKILIPPACREEVLGDLCERFKSSSQYLADLLSTLPFVVLSRIIRTTPIQLLLIDAFFVYGSFLAAAYLEPVRISDAGVLVRLAIPSGLTLFALLMSEAFAAPFKRWASGWSRSLVIMLALVGVCAVVGLLTYADFFGFMLSSNLVRAAKLMFEPGPGQQPQEAGGPALVAGRESRPLSRTAVVRVTLILLGMVCLIGLEMLWRRGVIP